MSNLRGGLLPLKLMKFLHSGSRGKANNNVSILPVARLFGPATFEASKLRVVLLGIDEEKVLPRTYTLTHCDFTSNLTLSISQTTNTCQGKATVLLSGCRYKDGTADCREMKWWENGRKSKEKCAFMCIVTFSSREALKDKTLFNSYPELRQASAWIHFHSNIPEFNKVECWGPLCQPKPPSGSHSIVKHCAAPQPRKKRAIPN
ncbi:UNVERIFIED_CONTAM: Protein STAY-GREEN, chloroplastic [Sesamum indicum]